MVGTVTLGIDRYNALYKRALQVDTLEKENAELRERLDGMTDESCEPMDDSEHSSNINTKIILDVTEYERLCKDNEELKRTNENLSICMSTEMLKKRRKMLEELEKTSTTYKPIEGLKLRCRRHYAKGGLTTKEEATELKKSKMKQRRIIK